MSYQQVLKAALALPIKKKKELKEQLEEDLANVNGDLLSDEWRAEIDKRVAEYKAGKAKTITWEEAKRRLRKLRESHGKR
jgi:putative addiction module component (TIGR02574 family)